MRRRRRPQREIAFSFDSFLDVVANVVGVILRLILVAWVGARTYKATLPVPPPSPLPALADPAPLPEPTDPRVPLLAQRRDDIHRRRDEADREAERIAAASRIARQLRDDLAALTARRGETESERERVQREAAERETAATAKALTTAELKERTKKLTAEMEKLASLPPPRKELRYHTPVSAPLQTEELMFECQRGRVTLIDHGAMLAEVHRELQSKAEKLKTTWEVADLTAPVGAFRLRYVVDRERSAMDVPGAPLGGSFRYGLSGWEVVPVQDERGETEAQALAKNSAFRRITETIEPKQTAVTFWVYPDSFALYRKLRDWLHEKDVVVAGRPLPFGTPVASTRNGTASRGQ